MSKFFGCPECGGIAEYIYEVETKEHSPRARIVCQSCGRRSGKVIFPKGASESYVGDFLLWEWYNRGKPNASYKCPVCGEELEFVRQKTEKKRQAYLRCNHCWAVSARAVFPPASSLVRVKGFLYREWRERVKREQS